VHVFVMLGVISSMRNVWRMLFIARLQLILFAVIVAFLVFDRDTVNSKMDRCTELQIPTCIIVGTVTRHLIFTYEHFLLYEMC